MGSDCEILISIMGPGNRQMLIEVIKLGSNMCIVSTTTKTFFIFYWFYNIVSNVYPAVFVSALFMEYEAFNILEAFFFLMYSMIVWMTVDL